MNHEEIARRLGDIVDQLRNSDPDDVIVLGGGIEITESPTRTTIKLWWDAINDAAPQLPIYHPCTNPTCGRPVRLADAHCCGPCGRAGLSRSMISADDHVPSCNIRTLQRRAGSPDES